MVVVPPAPPPRRAPPALISREDSFDRPDSPLFHETLPLPAESAIRRHRQRSRGRRAGASSASSSESEREGEGDVRRGGSRRLTREQRYQRRRRAASAGAKSRHVPSAAAGQTRLLVQTDALSSDTFLVDKGRTLVIAPLCRHGPLQSTWRAPSSIAHTL